MSEKLCGECMQMVRPEEMWSDYTCKKCAEQLGLTELEEDKKHE